MDLKWQDTEDIAIRLVEEHPETDPLTVRFTPETRNNPDALANLFVLYGVRFSPADSGSVFTFTSQAL